MVAWYRRSAYKERGVNGLAQMLKLPAVEVTGDLVFRVEGKGDDMKPTQRLAEQPGSRPVAILQSQDVTPPGERPLHRFPRETTQGLFEED